MRSSRWRDAWPEGTARSESSWVAAWLTRALVERHPGVHVKHVDVVESHEATNLHARLRITYEEAAGAPDAMFCKLLPLDPSRREAIADTGMGRLEVLFYASLAS